MGLDIRHLPLLGTAPQDRRLYHGEQVGWGGERYRVEFSHADIYSVYRLSSSWGAFFDEYIGDAKTLFDLEKLLGIPSAKPLQSADAPPITLSQGRMDV